jgi:hypothetical protein
MHARVRITYNLNDPALTVLWADVKGPMIRCITDLLKHDNADIVSLGHWRQSTAFRLMQAAQDNCTHQVHSHCS